ncbi:unnamed protein product [Ectocarpus sp. CCAP 1310/34]|nr:unnamed protein product [Ectocarpus sp. CCAP 1310/34]
MCFLRLQVDVLVDKAPILRQDSTPACLAELERRRSDIRTDGGVGVNRLGVVGPLVEQLVRLLPVSCIPITRTESAVAWYQSYPHS